MQALPGLTTLYKAQFCSGDFQSCARYRVASVLGSSGVPGNLYPAQQAKANELIAASDGAKPSR